MPLNKIIELPKLDSQSDRLAVFCREPKHEQWAIPPRMGGTAVTLTRPSMVPRRLVFPLLELASERAMTRMRFAHFVGCGRGSCLWTQAHARKLLQVLRCQLLFLALGREFNECPM